jgi:hypothetical protein
MTKKKLLAVIEYMGRHVRDGKDLTVWQCPHCEKHNLTVQPTDDLVSAKGYWDSVTECVHCPAMSFVLVWPNGKTKVKTL